MFRPMLVILLTGFVKAEISSTPSLLEHGAPINPAEEEFKQCIRKCDGHSRTCHYKLNIERYSVLGGACLECAFGTPSHCLRPQCITADGFYRSLVSVNRQLPAPAIQVCRGDRIIADVINLMPDATVTIHWHGIRQKDYQYYDGVPYVTQCPILPGTTFRYEFVVHDAGTFFYYSHTGSQKMDGVAGALIVRDVNDTQSHLYDEDLPQHVIFLSDWFHRPAEEYIPGFNHPKMKQIPDSFLINGRGNHWNDGAGTTLPLAEFKVRQGVRYRFRLIGGVFSNCAVTIKFGDMKQLVISADGNLKFTPKLVDTVVLNSGDRFDVVVETKQSSGTAFIFAMSNNIRYCTNILQHAVLKFEGSNSTVQKLDPPSLPRQLVVEFNAVESTCNAKNESKICISHLEGETDAPSSNSFGYMFVGVDFYYYYDIDLFSPGTYQPYNEPAQEIRYMSVLNNVSFKYPQSNLLTQFNEINNICSTDCQTMLDPKPCQCTNIYRLPYQSVINIVLYDNSAYTSMKHSFHLHGYNFYVLEQGKFLSMDPKKKKKTLDVLMQKLIDDEINLSRRPQRDTITIPARGYVLLRFYSDNPGYWLMHCNFLNHLLSGMAAVLKVGEQSDLPPVPKNFPRCGNFLTQT